jgi:hypothetical protein
MNLSTVKKKKKPKKGRRKRKSKEEEFHSSPFLSSASPYESIQHKYIGENTLTEPDQYTAIDFCLDTELIRAQCIACNMEAHDLSSF